MSLKKVVEVIKRKHKFLITAHVNLEGDALGSELALARLLRSLGKTVYVVNQDKTPIIYEFLPGVNKILQPTRKNLNFEVVFVVDCSDLDRIGTVRKLISDKTLVVNIDHHVGNTRFGNVNWIEPLTSSASEMIYALFKKGRFRLDPQTALLLYVGILVDTGSFRYANTTFQTHLAAADLLKYHLPIDKIYNRIYASMPLDEIKSLSRLLRDFQVDKTARIAWLTVRHGALKEHRMKTDVTEYVFNYLRSIQGIEVAVIFRELGRNQVRVNFRSNGYVDVARLARQLKGGGHKRASGCTVNAKLEPAQKKVFSLIKRAL